MACNRDGELESFGLIVVVRVNTECSVRCRFCGFSSDLNRPRTTIDPSVLEKLGQSLQEYQAAGNRRVLVSWLGGEPFQWPNWLRVSTEFVGRYKLAVSITTNGLALASPDIRRDALQLFDEITISIDGLAPHHDALRQRIGMYGRLRDVVAKLRMERRGRSPFLRVNTVLTRHNIDQFMLFIQTMRGWGFDELTFNPLGGNDRPEFFADNCLLPEQVTKLRNLLPSLRRALGNGGMNIRGSSMYFERLLASSENRKIPIDDCHPGTKFLFMDELGRLSPCSFTSCQLGISIDQLRGKPWSELPSIFQTRKRETQPLPCCDCHTTHVFEKFA